LNEQLAESLLFIFNKIDMCAKCTCTKK